MTHTEQMNWHFVTEMAKKFPCTLLDNGNIRTCPVRVSFPALIAPEAMQEGQVKKYGATFLFYPGFSVDVVKQGMHAAAIEKFGAYASEGSARKYGKTFAQDIIFGLRNMDEKAHKLDGYVPGGFFLSARAANRPGLVDRHRAPLSPEAFYAGAWVVATIRPFGTDNGGQKRVAFGLQNVQLLCDGDKFGGGSSPDDDFVDMSAAFDGISRDPDGGELSASDIPF